MSKFVEARGPGPLLAGELVDDHEVDSFEQDAFGHTDFVRELLGLVLQAPTPANVALFGAWGSGKSGIARLLAGELEREKKKDVRMACFDASKYAEAPLRRHFISRIATEFGIKSEQFHDGLYNAVDLNTVRFGKREWKRVLLSLFVLLIVFGAALVALAGLFSWISSDSLIEALPKVFAVVAPTSILLGVIVKVTADGFTVKKTRSTPSGDEEFEACFRELVKEAKTKRLVVFVDELDRCAPREVASVLETLKTFLFVPGCLFIVAADQQVLEQALRDEVRQHTPRDRTNPYYSSGSSYLDKVFQYQLTLPPLKPTTLSRFALRICEDLPGVWQRVPQLDEVISILIPTHVVSPRRVKVLLNRYAIAYRLAERRANEGRLDQDVGRRATELAKLVCLQCEFPLFAEDLRVDARLPDLVRKLADGDVLPKAVRPDVLALARRYANNAQPVARLLTSDEAGGAAPETAPEKPVDPNSPDIEPTGTTDGVGAVGRRYAQQLVNYLRKTREVHGPGPDLLFLESAGAEHDVDAIRAEELHRAAIDNDLDQVLALVEDVSSDNEARGALLVLADVVREDQPGLEGRNALSSLLQAIERSEVELAPQQADYMADAISDHLPSIGLDVLDLPGALRLSSASTRVVASKLFSSVLEHPTTTIDPALASLVVGYLTSPPPSLASRVEMIVAVAMLGAPAAAAEALQRLDDAHARSLVIAAYEQVSDIVRLHREATEAQQSDDDEADPDDLLLSEPEDSLGAIHDALRDSHRATARSVLDVMLRLSQKELRDAVVGRLAAHEPIDDPALIASVSTAVRHRQAAEWSRWLKPLSGGALAADGIASGTVGGLVTVLWRLSMAGASDEDVEDAVRSLGHVAEGLPVPVDEVQEAAIAAGGDAAFVSLEDLEKRERVWALGDLFVHAGLATERSFSDLRLSAAADTLRTEFPAQADGSPGAPPSELVDGVVDVLRTRGGSAGQGSLKAVADAAQESPWLLDESARCLVVLRTIAAGGQRFDVAPLPGLSTIRVVAREAPTDPHAREAIGIWINQPPVGPDDLFDIFASFSGSALAKPERAALVHRVTTFSSEDRWTLVARTVEAFVGGSASRSFVDCLGLSSLDSGQMADLLSGLWSAGLRLDEKNRLLELWMLTKVSSPAALQKLVREIYIPLAQSGTRSLDLAIKNFGLVAHVQGIRRAVREALRDSATNGAQKERIEKKLQEANWKSRSLKSLGRSRDID